MTHDTSDFQSTSFSAIIGRHGSGGEHRLAYRGRKALPSRGGETLRIGLIGAGGRGGGAVVDAFQADPHCKLVAIADIFRDRAFQCRSQLLAQPELAPRVEVPDDALFSDFDGYRQLIDSDVDVVLMATPPHFRPATWNTPSKRGSTASSKSPSPSMHPATNASWRPASAPRSKAYPSSPGCAIATIPRSWKRCREFATGRSVRS